MNENDERHVQLHFTTNSLLIYQTAPKTHTLRSHVLWLVSVKMLKVIVNKSNNTREVTKEERHFRLLQKSAHEQREKEICRRINSKRAVQFSAPKESTVNESQRNQVSPSIKQSEDNRPTR